MSSQKGKGRGASLDSVGDLSDLDGVLGDGLAGLDALGGLEDLDAPEGPNPDDPIEPLGLDYDALTNEEVAVKETSAVLEAFKARAKAEQDRFALATDSEYWVGVCFQTREQKEAWLEAVKLLQHGDKYIDGQLLAQRMGVTLPAAEVPYNVSAKVDKTLAAMVKDL